MIRSTFSGFTMAQLALQYNQKGLDVSGQNATNATTKGYTRQRLDMMSMNLSGLTGFYMTGANPNIGFGVELTGVSQLRDKFLDIQYRDQSAKVAVTEAVNHIQDLISDIFDETDKAAVSEQISKVRSALSSYSTHVGEGEHEAIVKAEFQSLINLLYRNHVDLQKMRADLQPSEDGQSSMSLDVAKVNDIIQNIARISKQITMSRTLGNPSLEMLDQRNLLLDELSTYLPITVKYTNKVSATEPEEKSAFVDYITITLNDGDKDPKNDIVLLQEQQYNIKATGAGAFVQLDPNGTGDIGDTIYFRQIGAEVAKAGETNANGDSIAGKTKLYVSGVSQNHDGTPMVNGTIDRGVYTLASKNIPRRFDSSTMAPGELYDVSGVMNGYNSNYAIAGGKLKGTLDMVNKEGTFDGTDVNGLGYYEKSLNLMVDKMVRMFNTMNTIPSTPHQTTNPLDYVLFDAEVPPNTVFKQETVLSSELQLKSGTRIPAGTIFPKDVQINGSTYLAGIPQPIDVVLTSPATLPVGTKFPVDSKIDAFIRTTSVPFTASNVRISEAWRTGKNHLTASKEYNAGSKQNENILAMLAAMDDKRDFDYAKAANGDLYTVDVGTPGSKLFKGSLQEFYTNIGVTLGVDKRSTDTLKQSQSTVKDAIAFNKDQVSGVDTNEETIAMIQYNKAYSAAARVMTAMDEMLETLMNTGRVGR